MVSEARLQFLKKMIILGPKTVILGPQFCRILVLGPHFWWSGGPGPPGPPWIRPWRTRFNVILATFLSKKNYIETKQMKSTGKYPRFKFQIKGREIMNICGLTEHFSIGFKFITLIKV